MLGVVIITCNFGCLFQVHYQWLILVPTQMVLSSLYVQKRQTGMLMPLFLEVYFIFDVLLLFYTHLERPWSCWDSQLI